MKNRVSRVKSLIVSLVALTVAQSAYCGVGEGSFGPARVIVPVPADAARQHLAWPKVVRTDSGLVLVCVSGARHGAVDDACEASSISTDGGENWSAPSYFTYPASTADWPYKGNLALGAEGNRVNLLSMAYDNGVNPKSGIIGRISDDGGVTWRYADTSAISSNKTGSVFGHVIDIPGRGLTAFGHYRPPARDPLGGIWMSSSTDRGETWSAPTTVLEKSGTVEPDFVFSNGRLIGLIREDKVDGSGAINGYWQIVSDDKGTTWSVPEKVMVDPAGGQSAAPCIFEDPSERGRLYVLQTCRRGNYGTSSCTGDIVVWTATAKDLVWRKIGTVASFSGVEDWGYASAASLGNGEWFVVFYAGKFLGANSIYGIRCAFDANRPPLETRYAKLENGTLSMSADCLVDGRLWLASGATDGGDQLARWDSVTQLQDVAAGDRVDVSVPLPDGAAFARVLLRELVRSETVTTNSFLPYLEGDGGQYLEVDYKLKSTDRVVAKVMGCDNVANGADAAAKQTGIFGSRAGASEKNICALWARDGSATYASDVSGSVILDFNNSNYATYRQNWNNLQTNTLYTIEMSAAERKVLRDGQEIPSRTGSKGACADVFEASTNCRLFDIPNKPASYKHCFVGRIYTFKIYESGGASPVRDLVPFVDADGKAKMKDLMTGGVYSNLGTGNFTYGEDLDVTVDVEESDGPALAWGPCVVTAAVPGGSVEPVVGPPEYVDVAPEVCVETGVKLKSDDRVEVKFVPLDNATTFSVFCQRDRNVSGAPNRFFLFGIPLLGSKWWNFDYAGQHSNNNVFGSVIINADYEFVCSTNGIFCNGVKAAYVPTYENFEANSTMELFASRNATTDAANNFANLRFYWLRVYNAAGALTAEILPRKRTTGGSAGNDGCVLVRKYVDGTVVSEAEQVNESGLSGSIKAGPSAGGDMPARQIVASRARDGALVASVSGGAAANLYLASGTQKGGSDPATWERLTFVTAVPEGTKGLAYSISAPSGARYALAFLGTGPTSGDLSGITVVSAGPCVSLSPRGLVIFMALR